MNDGDKSAIDQFAKRGIAIAIDHNSKTGYFHGVITDKGVEVFRNKSGFAKEEDAAFNALYWAYKFC